MGERDAARSRGQKAADARPRDTAAAPSGAAPSRAELRTLNERLLLAGMREQDLAEQLRQQLAFTGAVTDSLAEGLLATDAAGRITFANPAAGRLLGWPVAELLGQDAHALVHSGCADAACPLRAALRGGAPVRQDDQFTRRPGGAFPGAYTAAPILTTDAAAGAVVAFADISERQRAERALAEHAARVAALATERAAILEQVTDGIILTDPEGRITYVNAAARRLHGTAALGVPVEGYADAYHLLTPDGQPYPPAELPLARAVQRAETVVEARWRIRRPDGSEVTAGGSATPVLADDGALVSAVLICRDVTAQQALEQEKEAFYSSAAHDLQTPLTVIKGNAQLLLHQLQRPAPSPERLNTSLKQIVTTADQMSTLIRDLLDLTRLQVGQALDLLREPSDLVALSRRVAAGLDGPEDGRRIQVAAAAPELIGMWDAARLERVLGNLLANALKFSSKGSDILLTLAREADGEERPGAAAPTGGWAVVAVMDQGMGIPTADLPRIFERFHRGGNVAGRVAGTGIGLASAKQIVEQHGGTIAVASQEGAGTTVTVRLPLERIPARGGDVS